MMGLFGIVVAMMISPGVSAFALVPTHNNFPTRTSGRRHGATRAVDGLFAGANENGGSTEITVDELLERVKKKDEDEGTFDEEKVRDLIATLSSNADQYTLDEKSPSTLFEPLVGYYNVSCTLTSKPNDNPVGGKWTRGLWTVKRTMQHVLPPLPAKKVPTKSDDGVESGTALVVGDGVSATAVAQVVNAIRLELLWGIVNIWVLLRGDAVPLKLDRMVSEASGSEKDGDGDSGKKGSPPPKLLPNLSDRTVKAYFDRPLIGISLQGRKKSNPLWKQVLTLGPTSAVVLDTPYNDDRIRLGKGGTSGSQFVFRRLPEVDEEAREGWKWVLEKAAKASSQSLTKGKLLFRVGIAGLASAILSTVLQERWMKLGAGASALISGISMIGLLSSTGGIETEGDTYMKGRTQKARA